MSQEPLDPERPLGAGDPLFAGPLVELVARGLHRPSLTALCAAVPGVGSGGAPPPIDEGYVRRILDEEIGRQFGHPLRPIVELVLNAADARHEASAVGAPRGGGRHVVDVTLGTGRVEVVDRGVGMSLEGVLSRLLVPFATDKRPGTHLGRFGVGFFSVLGYGLARPEGFAVRVETGTADSGDGCAIDVAAAGTDAGGLRCWLRRRQGVRGTRVTVHSPLLDPDAVRAYLREMLHFFPAERALVRVDGVPLNDGSLLVGGQLFQDVVAADPETNAPLVARYQIGGRPLAGGILPGVYHAGVKVESCLAVGELVLIDFPAVVDVTEGRDALKPGVVFTAVAAGFLRRVAQLGRDVTEQAAKDRLAEIAAQVSAMLLQSAAWNQLAPELAKALLGEGRHLVSPERAEAVLGFLGDALGPCLFVPESFWAEREWQHFLPGERELLDRELAVGPPTPIHELASRRPDLKGLAHILPRAAGGQPILVALARGRHPPGPLPCLGTRRAILLREDSVALADPQTWADSYALRTSFDRALGLREADVERDMIVSDPVGLGGTP